MTAGPARRHLILDRCVNLASGRPGIDQVRQCCLSPDANSHATFLRFCDSVLDAFPERSVGCLLRQQPGTDILIDNSGIDDRRHRGTGTVNAYAPVGVGAESGYEALLFVLGQADDLAIGSLDQGRLMEPAPAGLAAAGRGALTTGAAGDRLPVLGGGAIRHAAGPFGPG